MLDQCSPTFGRALGSLSRPCHQPVVATPAPAPHAPASQRLQPSALPRPRSLQLSASQPPPRLTQLTPRLKLSVPKL